MCRPTASRTGNTPPQTQAQQWTQMLMTQGLILVKHKSSNLVGSPSSFLDFLWNCGHHATSAQPSIESVPPIPAEGGSVRLLIHHLPENLQGFAWFKGMSVFRDHEIARITTDMNSSVKGPAYSGRETLNSDGSLLLHNVTQNNAGLYTLRIMSTDMKSEEAHVQLHVNGKWFSVIVQC